MRYHDFPNLSRPRETADVIVVGSGISGGFAAKELTEAGLNVLLLERGFNLEHGSGYITEHLESWEFPARNSKGSRRHHELYPIQLRTYAFAEHTEHFFINDKENPYVEGDPFTWIRADIVGGRSLLWARQCYRWGPQDFEANVQDGMGVDWPLRYEEVAPWYDYVEQFAGITGQPEGLSQCPDGVFLPPMPLNWGERRVREAIETHFDDRLLTIGRAAILTQPHNGRAACHYCGGCYRGCSAGAYFSSLSATLPAAMATGRLTLQPESIVHSVIYDEAQEKATGVRYIDRGTGVMREAYARVIFLCASALGTTQIMLNSKSSRFPDGLANDSGALGHYLMDHHFQIGATGELPGGEGRYYQGRRPNGIYIPRFRNLSKKTQRNDYLRGFGYQGEAFRLSWDRATEGFGVKLKQTLRTPGSWHMVLEAFGEALPRYENYVTLDESVVDAWGMPVLRIHCKWGENEFAMREDMKESAAEMLDAAGAKNIEMYDHYSEDGLGAEPGLGIHEMGTARMGRDPRTSVLNAYNQCHSVPNVFVTDGACMTSSACQNPSITYMALTARAASHAADEMKRLNL
ncbi:MAG: GMC family oxidoreductase [Bacteroidetes bacterium]|nr:GMC family oxidoreductase [Bacteroidota bacterium]MCY4205927.1 GMC family oxidoreductase [Bacteroidota bacterium]